MECAAVAHLVERHLAKVEVASSSLVGRSITEQQQLLQYGPVAQLVRTLACHARGRQFEPDPGRHYASVAQSVEQGTENPRVIGSIPIGGTTSKILSFIGKSCKQDFCDEYQIFSFSPQNLAPQAFAGAPRFARIAREGAGINAPDMRP